MSIRLIYSVVPDRMLIAMGNILLVVASHRSLNYDNELKQGTKYFLQLITTSSVSYSLQSLRRERIRISDDTVALDSTGIALGFMTATQRPQCHGWRTASRLSEFGRAVIVCE